MQHQDEPTLIPDEPLQHLDAHSKNPLDHLHDTNPAYPIRFFIERGNRTADLEERLDLYYNACLFIHRRLEYLQQKHKFNKSITRALRERIVIRNYRRINHLEDYIILCPELDRVNPQDYNLKQITAEYQNLKSTKLELEGLIHLLERREPQQS
jgi:hypothetical protein